MSEPASHHPHHPHPNGSKKVFSWVSGVLGGVAIIFVVWIIGSVVAAGSEIRMINMRLAGVEEKLKELQQDIRRIKP